MTKAITLALVIALAGCAAPSNTRGYSSPCDEGEATYACQVERYHNISI